MNSTIRKEFFKQAKEWILEAGKTIRRKINDPLTIETKSDAKDLVTTMDKEIELLFAKQIKNKYPDHFLLSEEGYGDDLTSLKGTVWIIDPIDGTMNFVQQKRNFAISIGIFVDGVGEIGLIYDVIDDILYSAMRGQGAYKNDVKLPPLTKEVKLEESMLGFNHLWLCQNRLMDERIMHKLVKKVRGTRAYGSAALEFAYVAEGVMEGYLAMSLSPWDIAAGIVIVNEVGGVTTNLDGEPVNLLTKNPILTCHPSIKEQIINDYLRIGKK